MAKHLFTKGESGNPNGRPRGAINKTNRLIAELMEEHKEVLVKTAIQLALNGNTTILIKLLDKILPTLNKNDNVNYDAEFYEELRERIKDKEKQLLKSN